MMKHLKKTLCLLAFIAISGITFSQIDFSVLEAESENATIDANYCLILDSGAALSDYYEFDISQLGLSSSEEAYKAFGRCSNNLVSYIVDFDNQRVFARIYNDRIPDGEIGTVSWWNIYLNSLCGD